MSVKFNLSTLPVLLRCYFSLIKCPFSVIKITNCPKSTGIIQNSILAYQKAISKISYSVPSKLNRISRSTKIQKTINIRTYRIRLWCTRRKHQRSNYKWQAEAVDCFPSEFRRKQGNRGVVRVFRTRHCIRVVEQWGKSLEETMVDKEREQGEGEGAV